MFNRILAYVFHICLVVVGGAVPLRLYHHSPVSWRFGFLDTSGPLWLWSTLRKIVWSELDFSFAHDLLSKVQMIKYLDPQLPFILGSDTHYFGTFITYFCGVDEGQGTKVVHSRDLFQLSWAWWVGL